MAYTLFATKDNVEGQLNVGISASTTSILLQTGEGDNFPTTYNGTASSAGSSTTLNCTGIGSSGIAVGDAIWNVTDNSHAFVSVVTTNALATTPLKGGADNTWEASDVYVVNPFIITINKRDTNGDIVTHEKILVQERDEDTLTIHASGRGYDGSTSQEFDAGDYVNLFVTSRTLDEIVKAVSVLFRDKAEDADTVHASLGQEKGDIVGFSAANTPVRIPKASVDGKVLKSNSSATGGLEWADGGSTEFGTDVFRVQDETDNTKEVDFDLSAIATGVTRTITMGDSDVDLGDVLSRSNSILVATGEAQATSGAVTITHNLGVVPKLIIIAPYYDDVNKAFSGSLFFTSAGTKTTGVVLGTSAVGTWTINISSITSTQFSYSRSGGAVEKIHWVVIA